MTRNAPPGRSLFERILLRPWEFHNRRLFWGVRIVVGILLIGFGLLALSSGTWWALAFFAASAADFYLGFRIYEATAPGSETPRTRA
jgi:hypothetical protein